MVGAIIVFVVCYFVVCPVLFGIVKHDLPKRAPKGAPKCSALAADEAAKRAIKRYQRGVTW